MLIVRFLHKIRDIFQESEKFCHFLNRVQQNDGKRPIISHTCRRYPTLIFNFVPNLKTYFFHEIQL